MSRNSEKAQSLLFKYQEFKALEKGYININRLKRPRNVKSVKDLKLSEKWRNQVLGEISRKITLIQDEMLSDYQIRDLNDEINKLMREKLAWEYHIKEIGGPDYIRFSKKQNQNYSNEFVIRGYRYFGRAKHLPDVQELIKQQATEKQSNLKIFENEKSNKKLIYERLNRIDAEYYGLYEHDVNSEIAYSINKNQKNIYDQILDILGSEYIANDNKYKIMQENNLKISDSLENLDLNDHTNPDGKNFYNDELLNAEDDLSKKLFLKLKNNYNSNDKLINNSDDLSIIDIDNDEDPHQVPTLQEIENFILNRKKKLMKIEVNSR
ncbi:Isy1p [Ascoidea rubescens DSM 1968]|uniref:Pre-mRNA-splicing factor ISY1 n=1 Tax=Ascoidea rubescens DSM 1968 TaxID=1344418 RepID=A0A1D2VQR3_9ASCO|nr:Isy1-domain-containing protein [Ascoidea rubescens DSM 1968]ODV63956.1 Isy1-domain-containing protein [Ascoidea rubescens DSM 1968]